MTERLYRDDPYLLEFEATVVARHEREGRPGVVLDRTAFYPEGGGQPWDTGTLAGVPVLAVVEEADEILHVLAGPLETDRVRGVLDGARRRDHRQQHHGQHLLSRALVDVAAARTVSFHLGSDACSIDLDRDVDEEQVRAAEARANEVVWEARPVTVRTVTRDEARELAVEAPPEAGDAIRLVEAVGFDVQPCGGTHPRTTAEVGAVLVLGRERYRRGSRVRFVCGHRALQAFRTQTAVLDRLGALLSAPLGALPDAVQRLLERLESTTRRAEDLLERALEGEARRLLGAAGGSPALVVSAYDGWTPEDLRRLAAHLVSLAPCVVLLGSRAEKAHVVFAQSEGLGHDVPKLLAEAAGILEGKGGGRGNMAQGGGPRADRLEEALVRAAQSVGGHGPPR